MSSNDLDPDVLDQIRTASAPARQLLERYSNYSAATYVVQTQTDYDLAVMDMRGLKGEADRLEAARTAITQPMNNELRVINAAFKEVSGAVGDMLEIIRRKAAQWVTEQKRQAEEAARKAQEAAAKRQAKLEEQAAAARAEGKDARADILEERAAHVVSTPTPPAPVKAAGISQRVNWNCEIENYNLVPREYWTVDMSKIRAVVKALKGAHGIPGVRAWPEETLAVRK